MKKFLQILKNSIPILVMLTLIPLVKDDFLLTLLYVFVIGISFWLEYHRNELKIFILGFFIMILAEYLFVSTGVEVFKRNSLLGIMPLWLPFLWAYGYVAIKRSVLILDQ